MTSEAKKSIRAAAAVVACVAAVSIGAILRDRADLAPRRPLDLGQLVASNTNSTELPETQFFEDIASLLRDQYVDPIPDETSLANGAVRGMIASLGDPNSLYMDEKQFPVYSRARRGQYEGIGADLRLKVASTASGQKLDEDDPRLPKLVIAAIVPGSSAEQAGLRVGDWLESVNGHWVPNSEAIQELAALHDKVRANLSSPEYPKLAAQYLTLRSKLTQEFEENILPIRARDVLMIGANGKVSTVWMRDGKEMPRQLDKGRWSAPGFEVARNGVIRLPFVPGVAAKLADAIRAKKDVAIDLRNNLHGDIDVMLACLAVVAKPGNYGYFATERPEKPWPLQVANGPAEPPKLTLLVDRTTRAAAEIFALALRDHAGAKLVGGPMAGEPLVIRWTSLPEGAGYTLVTAKYQSENKR